MQFSRAMFCLSTIFVYSPPAYAYLDPGSASIALQAILAALAGGVATIKFWGHKIKGIFKRKAHKEKR